MSRTGRRAETISIFLIVSSLAMAAILLIVANSSSIPGADPVLVSPGNVAVSAPVLSESDAETVAPVCDPLPDPPEDIFIPPQSDTTTLPPGRYAYLTFDDGPCSTTGDILDILDQYGVKATFFVVGTSSHKEYYKEIVDRGHTIGLHANDHTYRKVYASEAAYFFDLGTLQNTVEEYTGVRSIIVRFPGGSSNTVSNRYCKGLMKKLIVEVPAAGFVYHDWNVDSRDAEDINVPSQQLINNIWSDMQGKDVIDVLMHDAETHATTVEALPQIIQMLLDSGYTLLPITNGTEPIQHHVK